MAYVQPRGTSHDLPAAALRQGTRLVAVAAYAAAVAVAFVLLSPVLPGRGSGAATIVPTGPQPVLYTVSPAETPDVIAASHGISLAQLYALNPDLSPFTHAQGEQLVVGLR